MARVFLLGSSSFIARAVVQAAKKRAIVCAALPRGASLDRLMPTDSLINFAITPAYRSSPYDEGQDCDLQAARTAKAAGAWFGMMSTRRVYGPTARWGAQEDGQASGDETIYGCNKARTEAAIRELLPSRAGLFRLSNIIGYEYDEARLRNSFLGTLLFSLKKKDKSTLT